MSRIYQHTLELLPQIKEMLAKGKTHKEIENALGADIIMAFEELEAMSLDPESYIKEYCQLCQD